MPLDVKLLYFLNGLTGRSHIFDLLVIFFAAYFQYIVVAAFLGLLYFAAYSRRQKIYIFWTTAVSIVVSRLGIAEIIRYFYNRPRPFFTYSVNKLLSNGWFYSDSERSFPSGHSAFFFALATAIFLFDKKWGVWFFVAAILINTSRVIAGVHYPSDILGGAAIGIASGWLVFYFARKLKTRAAAKI